PRTIPEHDRASNWMLPQEVVYLALEDENPAPLPEIRLTFRHIVVGESDVPMAPFLSSEPHGHRTMRDIPLRRALRNPKLVDHVCDSNDGPHKRQNEEINQDQGNKVHISLDRTTSPREGQSPVGMIPAFSTIRMTVRCGARVRCITPLGTTKPWRGSSSTVRPSRSISSRPSTT